MRAAKTWISRRLFSKSNLKNNLASPLKISEEVQQALNDKSKPVVSLESTIITHGLPYPQNMIMATETEKIIRDNGAIPATCAFIGGQPNVGLTRLQLEQLSDHSSSKRRVKVSRRDIGYTMAQGIDGGTTISGTIILSNLAGIKVFATGGLGGVHRDGQYTMDVSADLNELGQTPVAVVCAGPKSILDIGLTMEYLETQGVFVGTYNEDKRELIEIPGFYCRESGIKSPYSFNSFAEAANIIHQQNNLMSLSSGSVFCIPPPHESALSSDFITDFINKANEEAKIKGIRGKESTPFLLSKIAEATNGKSVQSNIDLVYNNAKCAAEISKSLLLLEKEEKNKNNDRKNAPTYTPAIFPNVSDKNCTFEAPDCVSTVIVGSTALDTSSRFLESNIAEGDSNPGCVQSCIGGVAYNISLACKYGMEAISKSSGGKSNSRLVSVVANDFAGKSLIKQLTVDGVDTSGIQVSKCDDHATAQYISMHDTKGDLILACADMSLIEKDSFAGHVKEQLQRAQPQNIVFDCNISAKVMDEALEFVNEKLSHANVIIEPTSSPKSKRISQMNTESLKVFPFNIILLITPTIAELKSIYFSFRSCGHFDNNHRWRAVLDSIGFDSKFQEKLNIIGSKNKILQDALDDEYLLQSFQLLPFFPNILLKLGARGALYISLSTNINDDSISNSPTSQYGPEFFVTSRGSLYEGSSKRMGIMIQYFPIPSENVDLAVKNVTGAGDSLLGYLLARLLASKNRKNDKLWLASEMEHPKQEQWKWESIYKAQIASGLSLQSNMAVSCKIKNLM